MATENISVEKSGDIFAVTCPFNPDVIAILKKMGGKWNAVAKTWSLPARVESEVRALLIDNFGTDNSMDSAIDTVTVRIVARDEIIENQGSIDFCGAIVARAFGRDSGATVGPAASLIGGDIKSGGSRQYWTTVVQKGAKFLVELPRNVLDRKGEGEESLWDFEIITETDDNNRRESLEKRRESLVAEIAKIDAELDALA